MSKKEKPKPKKVGSTWYLGEKTLDCHSCKYYAKTLEGDEPYCSYHEFKFKLDSAPGSDYSTCEHFTYDESKAPGELGVVGTIIWFLIIACILYFVCNLSIPATIILSLMIVFIIWISSSPRR